jgi:AraC family transcriptional regulator of adaptative response/methylated-DNA-[protein]-cysteine methyltransferase
MSARVAASAYVTVARAIGYLQAHATAQPSLEELAAHLGLSPFHLNRLFGDWAGITPKRFLQYLTRGHALRALKQSASVLDAAHAAGLSGPGRLHDLLVSCDAVSPGDVARGGAGMRIVCGVGETPFGMAFVATTARGICRLDLLDDSAAAERSRQLLATDYPLAQCSNDAQQAADILALVFSPGRSVSARSPLRLHLRGTNFQIQVWQALLRVQEGALISYGALAAGAGHPRAARAVGSALAANRVACLIPCHRVIRETGIIGPYRWGSERKAAMLAWEAGRADSALPRHAAD